MSQHDLEITNADANTGMSFRSAVNAALQALGNLQAGASEPGTKYKFELWADETTGKLKIRNAANSAWIEWGDLAKIGDPHAFLAAGRKLWIYENTAPTGWTIVSACADIVLACKGGSQAYNVNGGTLAGTWTQPNHSHTSGNFTLTTNEIPSHRHAFNLYGTGSTYSINLPYGLNPAGASLGEIDAGAGGLIGGGQAHNHGATGDAATVSSYRPYAAVGIVVQKD